MAKKTRSPNKTKTARCMHKMGMERIPMSSAKKACAIIRSV